MKQVKIGELYQELVIGLNGLIEKTVEIQEATSRNSVDYREALKLQIELEKTKLNIMETVGEGFHHKITDKGLTGYDAVSRPIFEIKDTGDARFVGKMLASEYKDNEKLKEEITLKDDIIESLLDDRKNMIDDYGKAVNQFVEYMKKLFDGKPTTVNVSIHGDNTSANNLAETIIKQIKKTGAK